MSWHQTILDLQVLSFSLPTNTCGGKSILKETGLNLAPLSLQETTTRRTRPCTWSFAAVISDPGLVQAKDKVFVHKIKFKTHFFLSIYESTLLGHRAFLSLSLFHSSSLKTCWQALLQRKTWFWAVVVAQLVEGSLPKFRYLRSAIGDPTFAKFNLPIVL